VFQRVVTGLNRSQRVRGRGRGRRGKGEKGGGLETCFNRSERVSRGRRRRVDDFGVTFILHQLKAEFF